MDDEIDFDDDFYNNYFIVDVGCNRPLKNYPQTLNKIEEVDETPHQDENGNIRKVAWNPHRQVIPITNRKNKQRPKSANYARDDDNDGKGDERIRPKSSCAGYPSRIPVKTGNQRNSYGEFCEYFRPKSACSMRPTNERDLGTCRSNSQPNMTNQKNVWSEVNQYRRSLRLLGLSHSDFGQPDSPKRDLQRSRTPSINGPTFSTRIIRRSISLDSLKDAVRKENCPRHLLAQAAYEEWYFKKSEEIAQKLKEEKEAKQELVKKLASEQETRREKSAQHLNKWMEAKRKLVKKPKIVDANLIKSREEIDKAYLEWKKKKSIVRKRVENDESEKEKLEKEEKRKQADKVFNEWKSKLLETQRQQKLKEQEIQERIRKKLNQQTKPRQSYQIWKQLKDNELREKSEKARDAAKQAEDTRSMIVTERMYEAEQAFEDWLEKIDNRRLKFKPKPKTNHDK